MNPGNPFEPEAPNFGAGAEGSTSPGATPPPGDPVVAYCRACGKGLTQAEVRNVGGTIYCAAHEPMTSGQRTTSPPSDSPWTVPPTAAPGASSGPAVGTSPGLAFLLGLIPGVGAIYNTQYAKGFIHVVVTGLLFSLADTRSGLDGLFKLMVPVWFVYMAFEAYHTARRRQLGQEVDEFSSIMPLHEQKGSVPVMPLVLIGLGVMFLLNNLDLIRIRQILPYLGPCLLIGLGVYMLIARLKEKVGHTPEVPHER